MLHKRLPGAAEDAGKFTPGIRRTHIDNSDGFDPGFGWFDAEQARGLAALHTAPEFAFGSDNKVPVERISVGRRQLRHIGGIKIQMPCLQYSPPNCSTNVRAINKSEKHQG